jgi:serine/tyrosine/threonine adenylyltransferase
MTSTAQPFKPANAISEIADFIADPVNAADFPEHRLRWRNNRAAAEIGLADLTDEQWIAHFGMFAPLSGSLPQPLALRYHGHQFRVYNLDIGDGRGFLFAQMRDHRDRLMDLGTKGSGQTPYSRFGDGRLTLKGGVREILATEMLEALGAETSRTFSLIETGEALHRGDEPSPTRSAVMVRLNHGHIRIGSFQRLATLGQTDALKRLTAYSLRHYYEADADIDAPARLLTHVATQTAKMAASFMAAGFVHGVLNTDNINISGESFDYGPWRFAPTFDAGFTAAYFDSAGLYRFGRQAEAIHWNVVQLAIALSQIADHDTLETAIAAFAPAYRAALIEKFLWRLGICTRGAAHDLAVVQALEMALTETGISLDRLFFDWAGGTSRNGDYSAPGFDALRQALVGYTPRINLAHPYWSADAPCTMLIEDVEALWKPIADTDDWALFNAKITLVRQMATALANHAPAA